MADKGKEKITIEPITFKNISHVPRVPSKTRPRTIPGETRPRTIEANSLKEKGYTLGGVLGKGSFAKVYKCIEDATGQAFVCKIMLTRKNDIEMAIREMDIMKGLPTHPNLVAWKDGFSDAHAIVIVMELCQGGTLLDYMKNKVSCTEEFSVPEFCEVRKKVPFTEREAATVMRDIIEAIKVCHQNDVMHLDVKPDNIVMDAGENPTYKLIDFGLSLKFTGQELKREPIGITPYTAPEMTKGCCGKEADIWSAGAILYELLSGIPPFFSAWETDLAHLICFGTMKRVNASEDARDLIAKMLVRETES
ncbi:putative protein kinase CAMK-CDPK family [Helianthus annuus]|nr:putative protein kinase CAMK-CDPK family [Helianthus annuus]KAJ0899990.1 putative protein kinase CAMK-CDPK family [Helianthus annuus]